MQPLSRSTRVWWLTVASGSSRTRASSTGVVSPRSTTGSLMRQRNGGDKALIRLASSEGAALMAVETLTAPAGREARRVTDAPPERGLRRPSGQRRTARSASRASRCSRDSPPLLAVEDASDRITAGAVRSSPDLDSRPARDRSPAVAVARQPAHARFQREHGAGEGLDRELAERQAVARAGHVQRAQVRAAEHGARRVGHRQMDRRVQRAVRAIAAHRAAAEETDPDPTLGVDRQAVGEPVAWVDHGQRPAVGDLAVGAVEVQHVDALGGAVDEVHPRAVGAPAEAMGDRRRTDDALELPAGGEPVERGGFRGPLLGHRPGPQAALRIALAVVEAVAGPVGLDLGEGDLSGALEGQEPMARPPQPPPAAGTGEHGAAPPRGLPPGPRAGPPAPPP